MIGSWYLTEAIFVAFLQFAGYLLLLLVLEEQIFLPMLLALAWRSLLIALGYLLAHHVLARRNISDPGFLWRMALAVLAYGFIYIAINTIGPMVTGSTVVRGGTVIVQDGMVTLPGLSKLVTRVFVDALVFCCSVAPILYIFERRRSRLR